MENDKELQPQSPQLATSTETTKEIDDDHDNDASVSEEPAGWKSHWDLLLGLFILLVMMILNFGFQYVPPQWADFAIHAVAYILAGWQVLAMAFRKLKRADFFNEFFLMSVATLGAFYIGSYSEGVAVMVFLDNVLNFVL